MSETVFSSPVIAGFTPSLRVQIFCRVIDNYGDIGVSWRLARQLMREYDAEVTLIVDDLATFARLLPCIDATAPDQRCTLPFARHPLHVVQWRSGQPDAVWTHAGSQLPDLLIEAFGCTLPAPWHLALGAAAAARKQMTCWVNLEYLSAEDWVESCHAGSSYPGSGGLKTFFFPGFTPETGGLIREQGLIARWQYFQQSQERMDEFLAGLGSPFCPDALKISLFCYPFSPFGPLFDSWKKSIQPVVVIAPGMTVEKYGLSPDYVIRQDHGSTVWQQGSLTLVMPPFLSLDDYDRLLWACDINFVRGEDSFVRAQWAARPFVWNIYPQDEAAHEVKLDAFLSRYHSIISHRQQALITAAMLAWNRPDEIALHDGIWDQCVSAIAPWTMQARAWSWHLSQQCDLAASLIRFYRDTTPEIG